MALATAASDCTVLKHMTCHALQGWGFLTLGALTFIPGDCGAQSPGTDRACCQCGLSGLLK